MCTVFGTSLYYTVKSKWKQFLREGGVLWRAFGGCEMLQAGGEKILFEQTRF